MIGNTLDKPGAILKREKFKKTSERDEKLGDSMRACEDERCEKQKCKRA